MTDNKFDVIIIGGSYSGLSTAMALGRSLRKVLIIDSGLPCNRQTPHAHNFLTHDGEKPSAIAQKGKEQVLNYNTVVYVNGIASKGHKTKDGFTITTNKGDNYKAKKLIFATGVKDIMPDIKGFSDCWGISIIHCPYCHGYEYHDKKTAIIANGERAVHLAELVKNLTDKLSLLTTAEADIDASEIAKLNKHKIHINEEKIIEVEHSNGHINNIVFENGAKIRFDVAYAAIPFIQHSDIPESLGCELTDLGHIKVDMFQKTTIPGVYACGDNASMMRSLAYAISTGNIAGAVCNNELVAERFGLT